MPNRGSSDTFTGQGFPDQLIDYIECGHFRGFLSRAKKRQMPPLQKWSKSRCNFDILGIID